MSSLLTGTSRISAKNVSLDLNLCASNPDLIISHLEARCDESHLSENVKKVALLRASRNSEIVVSNEAKHKKHVLSDQVARLMAGMGDTEDSTTACRELKEQVEGLNDLIHESDRTIEVLNEEIKKNFMTLPNLLNDGSVNSYTHFLLLLDHVCTEPIYYGAHAGCLREKTKTTTLSCPNGEQSVEKLANISDGTTTSLSLCEDWTCQLL